MTNESIFLTTSDMVLTSQEQKFVESVLAYLLSRNVRYYSGRVPEVENWFEIILMFEWKQIARLTLALDGVVSSSPESEHYVSDNIHLKNILLTKGFLAETFTEAENELITRILVSRGVYDEDKTKVLNLILGSKFDLKTWIVHDLFEKKVTVATEAIMRHRGDSLTSEQVYDILKYARVAPPPVVSAGTAGGQLDSICVIDCLSESVWFRHSTKSGEHPQTQAERMPWVTYIEGLLKGTCEELDVQWGDVPVDWVIEVTGFQDPVGVAKFLNVY